MLFMYAQVGLSINALVVHVVKIQANVLTNIYTSDPIVVFSFHLHSSHAASVPTKRNYFRERDDESFSAFRATIAHATYTFTQLFEASKHIVNRQIVLNETFNISNVLFIGAYLC